MSHHPEHTWGHTIPFGEEYYREITRLLKTLRDDASVIAEVARKATETIRSGHTVYANVTTGHMPTYELVNDREGNPAPFEFTGNDICTEEQFAAMQAGDMLMTNHVSEKERGARDEGVYVVVFTTCYVNSHIAPPGRVNPNENDLMPEDVASRVIDSHIPWEQGLVYIPQMPYMMAFPGSSNITCSIHWTITAEVVHAMATDGLPDGMRACEYIDILLERLADVHKSELDRMDETAVTMAKRFMDGGHYFIRSRNEAVASEAHGVAQGLMMVNAFEPRPASEGGDKDVMLIAAVSPNDPEELKWAHEARKNGNYIVGIGQPHNDGLRERCDVYFDNHCAEDAGVLTMPDRPDKVCPTTGIINNVTMQMLSAQFTDEMCRRGAVPYFWMGGYRVGGGAYNEMMRPRCLDRGY